MLKGKLVFAQLNAHLPRSVFNECVARYAGNVPDRCRSRIGTSGCA